MMARRTNHVSNEEIKFTYYSEIIPKCNFRFLYLFNMKSAHAIRNNMIFTIESFIATIHLLCGCSKTLSLQFN